MKITRRFFLVLLLFTICINATSATGTANKMNFNLTKEEIDFLKRHPVITAHNENDYPPYNFNEDGIAKGFSIDYLNLLAERLGVKIKYIPGYSWAEYMEMTKENKIDVMLNIMRTPQREKFLHYTQPYARINKAIFTNDSSIKTLRDLDGKTVSVIKGYFMEHFLQAYYPNAQLKLEKDAYSCIAAVKDGNSDATVGSSAIMRYLMKINNLYLAYGNLIKDRRLSLDLNIATAPELSVLRDILQKVMYDVGDKELDALKKKWIGNKELKVPVAGTLSAQELEYLRKKRVILACIDPDWKPIEFADTTNGYITKGITTDIMHIIGKDLNITFKTIPTDSWIESQSYLKEKRCDILPAAIKTKERQSYARFTYPYMDYKLAIITKNNNGFVSGLMDVIDKPIARKKGSALIAKLQQLYPAVDIIEVENTLESFRMVSEGKAFSTISTLPVASYCINKYNLDSIGIVGYIDTRLSISIAVRDDDTILLSILNKALATIPREQYKLIHDKWIGGQMPKSFDYLYLKYVVLVLLLMLVLGLYRHYVLNEANKGLSDAIKNKIEENIKQQRLMQEQSKLAAMGEMIGAIAHQWRQPLNVLGLSIQNLEYNFKDGFIDEDFIEHYVNKNNETISFMSRTIDDFLNFFRVDKEKENFSVREAIMETVAIQEAVLRNADVTLGIKGNDFEICSFRSEFQQVILNLITNAIYELKSAKLTQRNINISLEGESILIADNGKGITSEIIDRIFEPYFTTREQGEGTGIGLYMSKIIIEENMGGRLSVRNQKESGAIFVIDFS